MIKTFWTLLKKPRWLYSFSKRKTAWPLQQEISDLNGCMLAQEDDAAHFEPSPFYFEWWYFDVSFGEQSSLTVIFHLRDLIKPSSKQGSVNVSVYTRATGVWRRFIPYAIEQINACSEHCDVKIGHNRCCFENGRYRLHIEEKDIQAELEFTSLTPGWRPGSGKFTFGDDKKYFSWIVAQPKAQVSGKLVIFGQETAISGSGYHDHNWGTVSLIDTIQEWSWGRIYMGDYTCIFADITLSHPYGSPRLMPFVLLSGKKIILSSFLNSNEPLEDKNDFLKNPLSKDTPAGWRLQYEGPHEQLKVMLENEHILEKTDMLSGPYLKRFIVDALIAHPHYLRSHARAHGELEEQGLKTELKGGGIYEQITFGR